MGRAADPRALSLRKSEVQAVAEVLDQDHATVEDAAKAALAAAFRAFQERDWWALTTREFGLSYGPYSTENEAMSKALKGDELGIGGELFITKIHSTLNQEARVIELDDLSNRPDPECKCHHPASFHESGGRCIAPVRAVRAKSGTGPAKPCACRKWKESA